MTDILVYIITTIIGLWLGSVEYRIKTLMNKISELPDRTEVKDLIDMKGEGSKLLQKEIQEDVRRLETKVDKLIELQLNNK